MSAAGYAAAAAALGSIGLCAAAAARGLLVLAALAARRLRHRRDLARAIRSEVDAVTSEPGMRVLARIVREQDGGSHGRR